MCSPVLDAITESPQASQFIFDVLSAKVQPPFIRIVEAAADHNKYFALMFMLVFFGCLINLLRRMSRIVFRSAVLGIEL